MILVANLRKISETSKKTTKKYSKICQIRIFYVTLHPHSVRNTIFLMLQILPNFHIAR